MKINFRKYLSSCRKIDEKIVAAAVYSNIKVEKKNSAASKPSDYSEKKKKFVAGVPSENLKPLDVVKPRKVGHILM